MEIVYEPWKKLVIHELLEYQFDDFMQIMASSVRAVGGGIVAVNWANGVAFQIAPFADSEAVVEEGLKGTIHYSTVIFALKEKFEKDIRKEYGTFALTDVSGNELSKQLADFLKRHSRFGKKE